MHDEFTPLCLALDALRTATRSIQNVSNKEMWFAGSKQKTRSRVKSPRRNGYPKETVMAMERIQAKTDIMDIVFN